MRPLARTALWIGVNAVVSLLLLEVALRAQEPFLHLMSQGHHRSPNYRYAVVDHPVWDHQLRPGLRGFELEVRPSRVEPGFRYLLDTNSFGCRYAELEVPRPASRYRVIVMGDSFTEGYAEADTVSRQLEEALDAQGLPLDFEVMNCGMSSFSLLPILLRLREQLLAADPDAVIVNIDLTDLHDDYWRRRPDLRSDPDGRPLAVGRERAGASPLRDFAQAHSYAARALAAYGRLLDRLARRWLRGGAQGGRELHTLEDDYRPHRRDPEAAAEFEEAFAYFAGLLDRIVALCDEARIACAFTTYPHRAQLPAGGEPPRLHREFQRRIGERLARRGVFFYDATDAVAAALARDPDLYFEGDMHFRPSGQRAWGRAFATALAPWVTAAAQSSHAQRRSTAASVRSQ